MTLLPIVVRELRVAARQPRTFWLRAAVAGAFLALAMWIYWETRHFSAGSGREIFQVLAWLAWGGCLLAGPIFTADCLSFEKRENTLGLLFLTDLKGYDIVLGKLLSNSIATVLGLIGLFPVLAIPMLMGGVSYGEFGRVLLSLLNALFFSLASSIFVSSISRDTSRSASLSVAIVLVVSMALPGISELLRAYYGQPGAADVVSLFSPTHLHQVAMTFFGGRMIFRFWASLLTTHVIGWAFLTGACLLAPHTWQERPARPRQFFLKTWFQRWRQWNLGQTLAGRAFRTRALACNPFFWLAGRERIVSLGFFFLTVVLTSGAMWVCWRYLVKGNLEPSEAMLLSWAWVTVVMHVVLLARIAALAGRRLSEDRHSGALELVLATPLSVGRILAGQWLALLRQCLGPILIVLFLHGVFLWACAHKLASDLDPTVSAGRLVFDALRSVWASSKPQEFGSVVFSINITCIVAVIAALHWVALGWVGMWLGLRLKHARHAPWTAVILVFCPPLVVFGMVMDELSGFSYIFGGESGFFAFSLKVLLGIQLTHNGLLSIWAWRNLRKRFRTVATNRFQTTRWTWPWFLRWRVLLRLALGAVTMFLLVIVAYCFERWRGARAWEKVRRQAVARGEDIRWASLLPAATEGRLELSQMPAFSNFFNTPLPYSYSPAPGFPVATPTMPPGALQAVTVTGQFKGRASATPGLGHWMTGQRTDLERCQRYYQNARPFPKADQPTNAASAVLFALEVFQAELKEIELIEPQPEALLSAWRKRNANDPEQLWTVLYNLSELLNLRAIAALAVGRSNDALHDVRLALRVAEVPRQEPRLSGQHLRYQISEHVVRTIWEGLLDRRWSREQLTELERELSRFNLLAEYDLAVRGEVLWQIERWNYLLDAKPPFQLPPDWNLGGWNAWLSLVEYYPRGWVMQNQTRLYRFYDERLRGLAEPAAGRIQFPNGLFEFEDSSVRSALLGGSSASYSSGRFSDYIYRLALGQTAMNLARLACALEQFQMDHGAYPEALATLAPAYLETLPCDVFTGEAMHYQQTDNGRYVLYSVGTNLKDDGGIGGWDRDWVWHVEATIPQKRR